MRPRKRSHLPCVAIFLASSVAPGQAVAPPAEKPLDLVWTHEDYNSLPLRPRWRLERDGRGVPDPLSVCDWRIGPSSCTSQQTEFDLGNHAPVIAGTCACSSDAGRPGGHINWCPATYDGRLIFHEIAPDDDLGFYLVPLDQNDVGGQVKANRGHPDRRGGSIQVEASFHETTERFRSSWWFEFDKLRRGPNKIAATAAMSKMLKTSDKEWPYTVISGLLGLDCEHDCHTELHPVFSLAARVAIDDAAPRTEQWVFFVTNNGSEGSCSEWWHWWRGQDTGHYWILLPWRRGMADVAVTGTPEPIERPSGHRLSSEAYSNCRSSEIAHVYYEVGRGVLIDVVLDRPESNCRIDGQLAFQWTAGGAPGLGNRIEGRSSIGVDLFERARVQGSSTGRKLRLGDDTHRVSIPKAQKATLSDVVSARPGPGSR